MSSPHDGQLDSLTQMDNNVVKCGDSSSIAIVVDGIHTGCADQFGLFSGWQWEFLRGKILRAGFVPEKCEFHLLSPDLQVNADLIVGMGEGVLRHFTDRKSIFKWHLSPLETKCGRKFIPTFGIDQVQKQYELGLYLELAFLRAAEYSGASGFQRPEERFLLNPSLEETYAILTFLETQPALSVDVETGYGQINTVGFAWSESEAIAINTLPERCGDNEYYNLWQRIGRVLEGPSEKIFQNFIYDVSYFSAYGIKTEKITHDTMWAMKFLWPELDMGLGNVGRIYTRRPYWKDDGKVESEEGKKKDWGNVRDWTRHYLYNCRDTTGTFEARGRQVADLKARGLYEVFTSYLMQLHEPVLEMCSRGMPVCHDVRGRLRTEIEGRIAALTEQFNREVGFELNPRSPKQVKEYLLAQGVKLPKKFDKETGKYKESTDSKSIKKIRLAHPDLASLGTLAEIKTLDTALSRYIAPDVRPSDGRAPFSLGKLTETLRFAGGTDPWGRGFNIQTIPREGGEVSIKSMMVAPEGMSFLEVDLSQAESRFVAYDAPEPKMIEMLESKADMHKHVALAILRAFGKSESDYEKKWRDLGKKTGHGANYMMKAGTFVENVFADMGMVLSKKEGDLTLQAYYAEFPGVTARHRRIRSELYNKRKLTAPSGWERYFYGRPGDDMVREGVAWAPQHTIPWVLNKMLLYLCEERRLGKLEFQLIAQVHDSLILLVDDGRVEGVARTCMDTQKWHPTILLPGGSLVIPCDAKAGKCLAKMEKI